MKKYFDDELQDIVGLLDHIAKILCAFPWMFSLLYQRKAKFKVKKSFCIERNKIDDINVETYRCYWICKLEFVTIFKNHFISLRIMYSDQRADILYSLYTMFSRSKTLQHLQFATWHYYFCKSFKLSSIFHSWHRLVNQKLCITHDQNPWENKTTWYHILRSENSPDNLKIRQSMYLAL